MGDGERSDYESETGVSDMIDPSPINSSFSSLSPGLQLGIDSTSLGAFKTCPRKYYYSIVRGLQPKGSSPHLRFGILIHQAREHYDHSRLLGLPHDEALDSVLDWALCETWNKELGRPWSSGHDVKNRQTFIQTLVWYLDTLGKDDPFETLTLANGKPAVELSFRFDSGLRSRAGEAILLCGHIDRIGKMNGEPYILDIKTTTSNPDQSWARREFTPGNQFSLYSLAGRVAFGIPVRDLIVDGIQVGVTFARFGRHLVPRTDAGLEEWLRDTGHFVESMEQCAEAQYWPQNDCSCKLYGGCPFQALCSRSPASREAWIEGEYETRVWNPLQSREGA